MRGCFHQSELVVLDDSVLPAYAGMFPNTTQIALPLLSSPRVCGDVSKRTQQRAGSSAFSPRMRGCFWYETSESLTPMVLPAYAGMFPAILRGIRTLPGSPRVCGDVSGAIVQDSLGNQFSPRMRGCFHVHPPLGSSRRVLPAYAGMFPDRQTRDHPGGGSPRVCGDVSRKLVGFSGQNRFSPRMQGCFQGCPAALRSSSVLPAYAGMFPHDF